MYSFSGKFPLEFISFYLVMSSEERNEANLDVAAEAKVEESAPQTHIEAEARQSTETHEDGLPAASNNSEEAVCNAARVGPTPSPSTDESISAYIERTLQTLGCQGTGLDITFLPPTDPVANGDAQEPDAEKVSESDPIS